MPWCYAEVQAEEGIDMAKKAAKKKTAKKTTKKKSAKVATKRVAGNAAKPTATSSDLLSATKLIDAKIKELGDWRGKSLSRVRALIKQADPDVVEEVKWRKPSNSMLGVPVWSHDGIICTGETYKDKVKLTFAKGASVDDPTGLFNASLAGNTRRAIDLHEGDDANENAFKALIRAAVALNVSGKKK